MLASTRVNAMTGSTRRIAIGIAAATIAACGGGSDPVVSVASVSVNPTTTTVAFGGTTQLAASTLDANGAVLGGRAVTWSTSNASVATVAAGLVTGVSAGTATITATSEGKSGIAVITVAPPPVATVTITPANPTLSEIDTLRLSAQLRAADGTVLTGRTISWSSATPTVATINANGRITGVATGTSVITATSEGRTGTVTVTVTQSPCNISLAKPIVSGTPITGALAAGDCPWVDNTFTDIYTFTLAASTNVDIRLRSTAFDAYLYTVSRNPAGELVITGENDDEAMNVSDSRLTGTMPAGVHYILANSFDPATGAYTLTLTAPFTPTLNAPSSFMFPAPSITLERASPSDAQQIRALMRRRGR